jgi:hypothetical protein
MYVTECACKEFGTNSTNDVVKNFAKVERLHCTKAKLGGRFFHTCIVFPGKIDFFEEFLN